MQVGKSIYVATRFALRPPPPAAATTVGAPSPLSLPSPATHLPPKANKTNISYPNATTNYGVNDSSAVRIHHTLTDTQTPADRTALGESELEINPATISNSSTSGGETSGPLPTKKPTDPSQSGVENNTQNFSQPGFLLALLESFVLKEAGYVLVVLWSNIMMIIM